MLRKNLLLAPLALLLAATAFPRMLSAQDTPAPFNLRVSTSVYGSSNGPLPFWLHSNKDGKIDSSSVNWVNEIGFSTDLFDYGELSVDAGGNLVVRFSNHSSTHFNELYLHADLGGYRISAGRFIDPIGLNSHNLSVGSMMVSRNATPVPKISLQTPEFLDVPFLNGRVQYKGMFSHGWLEESRFVSNALLHQKYFYLRVHAGNFSGTGGIVHNVIWGGEHPRLGQFPQSFGDFLRVVTGMAADSSSNAPTSDIRNVIGNSIAAYEFGLNYKHEQFTASLTRLFYLEDIVSALFRSPWDGVWGFNFSTKERDRFITDFIYEHINTKQQDAKPSQGIGRANYYHNGIYRSGWTYNERILGLPLILFNTEGLYDEQTKSIRNNMIVGHHVGIQGLITKQLRYKLLSTYSRNYGFNPYGDREIRLDLKSRRTDQYSFYLALQYQLPKTKKLSISLAVGSDTGQLYEDNIGFGLGITWEALPLSHLMHSAP